eukprot:2706656-Prymnesium_polylepis.1
MADAEKELDLRMARLFVPDSTSQVERERLRELLQQMQVGVQEHNSYVKDFVQWESARVEPLSALTGHSMTTVLAP